MTQYPDEFGADGMPPQPVRKTDMLALVAPLLRRWRSNAVEPAGVVKKKIDNTAEAGGVAKRDDYDDRIDAELKDLDG